MVGSGRAPAALSAEALRAHFGVEGLNAFELEGHAPLIGAAAAVLAYAKASVAQDLDQLDHFEVLHQGETVLIDARSRLNLELDHGEHTNRIQSKVPTWHRQFEKIVVFAMLRADDRDIALDLHRSDGPVRGCFTK